MVLLRYQAFTVPFNNIKLLYMPSILVHIRNVIMAILNLQKLKGLFSNRALLAATPEKQPGDAAKSEVIPVSSAASSYVLNRNYQGSSRSVTQHC